MTERLLTDWDLCYRGWDPTAQLAREALMTLGNGHFATRGAAEESRAGGPHYILERISAAAMIGPRARLPEG